MTQQKNTAIIYIVNSKNKNYSEVVDFVVFAYGTTFTWLLELATTRALGSFAENSSIERSTVFPAQRELFVSHAKYMNKKIFFKGEEK